MKCKFAKTNSPAATLRRAITLSGLTLTALLAALPHAGAQSPVVSSPGVPTSYSWPNFHAGGSQVPQVNSSDTALSGQYYTLPDTYNFANPLSWQLNGTPTGPYTDPATGTVYNVATEIPSFLLGNFSPTQSPSGGLLTFFPNHFRDGGIYQIAGPFAFNGPYAYAAAAESVDDTNPNNTDKTPNVFALSDNTWGTVNSTTDTTGGTYTTATNQEYRTHTLAAQGVTSTTMAPLPTAQWTISPSAYNVVVPPATVAAPLPAGFYTVMVHLPNSADAATNSTATSPLIFSQDAHYQVRLNSTTSAPIADVRIAQGIVNDQVLAGPFLLQSADVLYVTLDDATNLAQAANTVVVADSISLVPSYGGDVESAPAVVSATEYPEIANAEYYGVASAASVGGSSTSIPTTTIPAPDLNPSGNTTINTTPFDPTQNVSSNPAGQQTNHRVRQLVYFGRLETVAETQPSSGGTVQGYPTTGAVATQQVGAIYCMDGFTGGIVWRYQTPGTYNSLSQTTSASGPVFSSPTVSRINVLAAPGTTTPYATKLVVVIADNRGFVYCLDAVGSRDGTSNSTSVYQSTDNTKPNYITDTRLNGLPILNPGVGINGRPVYTVGGTGYQGLGDFGTTTTDPPHEGNTTAYWVYRPDSLRPKVVFGGTPGKIKTTSDPASDLPVPGAFGLASPTVYTAGYVPTATGATGATDYPGATGVAALNSNSVVFIGNGNGVLYALDGLGYPVTFTQPTTGTAYLDAGTTGDPFNATLDIENKLQGATTTTAFLPTPKPLWWFSIRGAVYDPNNTSTATIESAPAVFVNPVGTTGGTNQTGNVTVYVTSAHESTSVTSSGRLYAVNGLLGPSGNGGRSIPTAPITLPTGTIPTASVSVAGTFNYNVNQRPQLSKTDTQHWSFPDAYGTDTYVTGQSSNGKARLPLGNITGSPVVFANTKQPVTIAGNTYPTVNIYFAANSGPEVEYDLTTGNQLAAVPDDNTTGRIWKVNLDGSMKWAYPVANDPNNAKLQNIAEPSPPMGAFLHATPAMGYVQFPTQIALGDSTATTPDYYVHPDQHNANIAGLSVPMLYIATSGYDDAIAGPGFYSLDIDNDAPYNSATPYTNTASDAPAADDAREIEAIASPSGESFVSSPALLTNPSLTAVGATTAGPGNGGAVYVVGSNGTLVQFGATPITNNFADGTKSPYFSVDRQILGYGPISAPAIAAANVFDLNTTATSTFFAGNSVQDRVFIGSSDGLCYGLTFAGTNGGGFDPGTVGPAPGPGTDGTPGAISNQFILHGYVVTDSTQKAFTNADVKSATLSTATPFEWGENVYIRFTNVVPPASPNGTVTYKVYDPTDTTGGYYANGQPVTFQISSSSPTGGTGTTAPTSPVPAVLANAFPGTLPGNGFVLGTDTNVTNFPAGALTTDSTGKATMYSASNTNVWVAATTFPVRNEEPGAQHRLISATQVASHYAKDGTFLGSVTLQATVGQGTQLEDPRNPGHLLVVPPVTQPVFAVLNPLAVRGAGIPIAFTAAKPAEPIGNFAVAGPGGDGLGPFRGLADRTFPPGTTPTHYDLQALTNGNRVYTRTAPPASVSGTITGPGGGRRRNRQTNYPQRLVRITTSTGLINHNSTGSNADPNATAAVTLLGNVGQNTDNGLSPVPAYPYGQYTLDVADRSALGLAGLSIGTLRMERNALGWNDNTGLFGNATTQADPTNGAGATINPLPWDDTPVTGSNHSRDYPDIRASATADILNNTDLTTGSGTPDPAQVKTDIDHRNVVADPVKVQVSVPRYQPANLMFFDTANGPITPDNVTPAITNSTFPMGYINTVRVFVDTNKNGRLDPGEAYRSVQVFSGVPVDMTTSIDTPTTDLGKLPQGFGLQTDAFAPLGTFMPYPTATQINGNGGAYLGNTQNPGYVSFFKPLTISNRGNTNLLNVHLDQKLDTDPNRKTRGLPLVGDTLDTASQLLSYDSSGSGSTAVTGPPGTTPLPGSTILPGDGARSFLIRSSLDDDLVAAYGHNPGFLAAGTPYTSLGATFHKSRVGDSNPVILTVPDVPRDNDPTNAGNGYNLAVVSSHPPVATQTGLRTSATGGLRAASIPYVALAIPQGTPVGTYATRLQLFEGVDPSGYKDIYNGGAASTGPYVPILPPQYGTQTINPATNTSPAFAPYPGSVASDLYGDLVDTLIAPGNVPSLPYSNGTVIKAGVTEARLTDGFSRGDLPQIDARGAILSGASILSSADFLPSAFRDPATGNVSLYWTSARTQPYEAYGLFGANLSDNNNTYFKASTLSNNWWSPITLTLPTSAAPTTTINSAISVVPTGNYAFVQSVTSGTGAPVRNNLLCYQVAPGTGALSNTAVPVTLNTAQAIQGAHGLVTTGAGFKDAIDSATPIGNDLWAFWYGGARGRSTISYAASTANGGPPAAFGPTATLPIPAGLVSVSDPTAVFSYAPDTTDPTKFYPVIEVTYTGIAPDGNADIYVSRYRPYYVRNAQGGQTTPVALALLPSPPINEQLQATGGNLYYQARDVAWARNDLLNVFVGATSVLRNLGAAKNADGSYPLNNGVSETFDRPTGTLVYTARAPGFPLVTINGQFVVVNAVYVDLARGRVRFSFNPQVSAAAGVSAYATFTPQARRITTDTRADTAPVTFIDTAPKPNEANSAGTNVGTVEPDRYWFIWRKSGATGTSTVPTLYDKTQRLTVDLRLRDANTGQPIGIQLVNQGSATAPNYKPNVTVKLGGTTLYSPGSTSSIVDIDWVRGRLYFPVLSGLPTAAGTLALEGQTVTVTGTDKNGKAIGGTNGITDTVHWLDEPRYNENSSSTVAPLPTGSPITTTALSAAATGDTAVPIDTVSNESNVTAFLDPLASATRPHKVWLFWNSTRNGTADIYYETISPLFSATVSP